LASPPFIEMNPTIPQVSADTLRQRCSHSVHTPRNPHPKRRR
jgi:hypothetical protein